MLVAIIVDDGWMDEERSQRAKREKVIIRIIPPRFFFPAVRWIQLIFMMDVSKQGFHHLPSPTFQSSSLVDCLVQEFIGPVFRCFHS
jgi:hypothetical protein